MTPGLYLPAEPGLRAQLVREDLPSHDGGYPGGRLENIRNFLVAQLQPEKIFLSDGYFREVPGNPDLLIIIPDHSGIPFDEYHLFIAAGYPGGVPFTYSLHMGYDLYRMLLEGHIFYSAVCTPANLLYDNGERPLPLSLPERAGVIRTQARQLFYDGLKKGVVFLEHAWQALEHTDNGLTAFLLQQAVEIPLRSLLQALTGEDLHTHSITKLCSCCRRCAPQLGEFFPDHSEREKRLLALLDTAYIQGRYTARFLPVKTDLLLLYDRIRLVHYTIRHLFDQRMAAFG